MAISVGIVEQVYEDVVGLRFVDCAECGKPLARDNETGLCFMCRTYHEYAISIDKESLSDEAKKEAFNRSL